MVGRVTLAAALALALVGAVVGPASATAALSVPSTRNASAAPTHRAALTGSVLGYQCGPAVCLIDPDVPGAKPTQVVPEGRFAGVTADGQTVAWVPPAGGLLTAPTAGGPPTTVFTGSVGTQPVISPDGSRFLWTSPVPVYIGFYAYYYTYRLDVATGELVGVGACACASSHGFVAQTSIGTFPRNGTTASSRICVIGTKAETGSSTSCGPVQASDPRGVLSFPDGSPDGQQFVAAMDPANSDYGGFQGRIALYSRATGALIKDITTNDTDSTPTFSAEGDRVAFDRNDQIVIVDIDTGAERVIGPGVYPSWGGTGGGGAGAVAGSASVKGTQLRAKATGVKVRIACSASGACRGKATLGKAKVSYAAKSYAIPAGRTVAVKLKLTKIGKTRFSGNGKRRLTLTLSAADDRTARKRVTITY